MNLLEVLLFAIGLNFEGLALRCELLELWSYHARVMHTTDVILLTAKQMTFT